MLLTHKYRIYPNKAQTTRLENQFSMCRYLYNWALEDRIWLYENHSVSISLFEQSNELTFLKKERPWFGSVHSQVLQNTLKRLDTAYKSFFRRIKSGEAKAGFPKFKKFKDWSSITYPQFKERPIDGILKISKIGNIKIKYHREIPENGTIKTLTISKEAGKWFVCFSFENHLKVEIKQNPTTFLGIDLGLNDFYYDSDGNSVKSPKSFRANEKSLANLQRKLSKTTKRTKKYSRLLKAIRKCHYRIKCQRNDFLHKTANKLLSISDVIVYEKLNVKNMIKRATPIKDPNSDEYLPNGASVKSGLNKSIADASWSKFLLFLQYKASILGKQLIPVNPAYTSQMCSNPACGRVVKKTLSTRIHRCPHCNLVLNRDHNAAINILRLGLQSQELILQEASSIASA